MEEENNSPEIPKDKRLQNLRPARPGEVRNPNGRPKGSMNLKTVFNKFLKIKEPTTNPITKRACNLSQIEIMALAMIKEARNGNVQAFNAIADRLEGKPEQKQINAFEEGTEISVTIGKPRDMQQDA